MPELANDQENDTSKAYVCPMCRFTFKISYRKVPAVACPGCHYLVSINDSVTKLKSSREMVSGFQQQRVIEWEREHSEEEVKSTNYALIGTLVLCLAAVGVVSWKVLTDEKIQPAEVDPSELYGSAKSIEEMNRAERALFFSKEVGKAFLSSETVDEVWQFVDQDEASRESLEDFYQDTPLEGFPDVEVRTATFDSETDTARLTYSYGARTFRLKMNISGEQAKVDWAAYTGYFADDVEELKQGKDSVVVRAFCAIGLNYNFTVTQDEWLCVRLKNYKTDSDLFAYVKRSEVKTYNDIDNVLQSDRQLGTLRLELLPFGDSSTKYKIIEVVEKEW